MTHFRPLALTVLVALPMLLGATSAAPGPIESCLRTAKSPGCVSTRLYDRSLAEPESSFGTRSATAPPAGNPPAHNEVAAGFRVPDGDAAILEDLSLLVYRFAGTDLTVTLVGSQPATGPRTGSSNIEPDSSAIVEQWHVSVTGFRFNLVELQSRSRPILKPNEIYWAVISTSQPGANIGWVADPTEVGDPVWFAERNSTLPDFDWVAFGPRPDGFKMQVNATIWEHPTAQSAT